MDMLKDLGIAGTPEFMFWAGDWSEDNNEPFAKVSGANSMGDVRQYVEDAIAIYDDYLA